MTIRRVLGLDPGTRVAGYGILDVSAGAGIPALVAHGAIRLDGDLPVKLRSLHEELGRLIREHGPQALAVETVFHGKSFESVLKLGQARGIVLLAGALHEMEVQEYTPATVKRIVTGNGRASKSQVQSMVSRLLRLDERLRPPDVTDALALALCYGRRLWRNGDVLDAATEREPSRARELLKALSTRRNRKKGRRS